MRAICKVCKASPCEDYCKGDDSSCVKVMRYDMGYNDAVEKAAEWIRVFIDPVANHYKGGMDGLVESFKKAMEI